MEFIKSFISKISVFISIFLSYSPLEIYFAFVISLFIGLVMDLEIINPIIVEARISKTPIPNIILFTISRKTNSFCI